MDIIRGDLRKLSGLGSPHALTIGNFDGVHRGHQKLIEKLIELSAPEKLEPAVLSFDPHPESLFSGDQFQSLSTLEDKIAKLEKAGVKKLFIQSFDEAFAALSPESFVRDLVAPTLKPRLILLGYDFRFGNKGQGDISTFKKYYGDKKVPVDSFEVFQYQSEVVSSTRIRQCLSEGDVHKAGELLGENYALRGMVEKGDQLGRKLGFPTANLHGIKTMIPSFGVYWGQVIHDDKIWGAVLNVGVRPTLASGEKRIEVHLLDFQGDLYGRELEFHFAGKLRDEKKFANLEELKKQIRDDVNQARALLKNYGK